MVPQEIFLKVLVPKLLPGNAFKLSVLLSDHIILYIRRIFLAPGGGGGRCVHPRAAPAYGPAYDKTENYKFYVHCKKQKTYFNI